MASPDLIHNPYAVNPQPFAGKVITVTGASRGTGLALSKYLLARGATVSMCATTAANLEKAAKEIDELLPDAKSRYWMKVVDIGVPENVKSWIEETVQKFGPLDGCANVAAVEQRDIYPITALDVDYFTKLLNVNVVGTFNCLQAQMAKIKDGGAIVNCGSITSNYASQGVAAYVSSKHAIIGLSKVAAFEGAHRNIRVNCLNPGCINTEMMEKPFNLPDGSQFSLSKDNIPCLLKRPLAEPWEIAASIAFLLGDESTYVTKASWAHDGGWTEGSYSSG
ncbi:NAD(P)-binding protein [Periconia macrospinosa]|uniref:NAD(P)-binding protein n=1 Tax=Periconia macrospinosa TaxID=97972 RepID=A0A2V1DA39_9PLEO|nr:NAD(P)-binding protein [Periconia macrospinosa]